MSACEYYGDCQLYIAANPCTSVTYYRDYDGDGFGRNAGKISSCTDPSFSLPSASSAGAAAAAAYTWVTKGGDCNDLNRWIYPGAPEICFDTVDNNCNGYQNEPPCISKQQAQAMGIQVY